MRHEKAAVPCHRSVSTYGCSKPGSADLELMSTDPFLLLLLLQVAWQGSGGNEKFFFENENVSWPGQGQPRDSVEQQFSSPCPALPPLGTEVVGGEGQHKAPNEA